MSNPVCENCRHADVAHEVAQFPPAKPLHLCKDCYQNSILVTREGVEYSWYTPQPHQWPYHESNVPNLLALGTRGTGKSTQMRKDAIIRCIKFAGFKVLILRRTIPDLRKSHLQFINSDMKQLDPSGTEIGYYRETTFDVKFVNDSFIQFSHCESLKDVENYLSSQWDLIIFDELSTFTLNMFLMISAAARSLTDAPYKALVRCGSNPLGIGAGWMKQWFIDKNVNLEDYPDYNPNDFEMMFSTLDQNRYVNRKEYEKRLRNVPEHIRKAWLLGEFVIEGAYFTDFNLRTHAIMELPTLRGRPLLDVSWINVYRAIDWGYWPDPAVCLWIAMLPNKRAIVFKERSWKRTLATEVAKQIKAESDGMHIVESFCDPTMFIKDGAIAFSIGEIFEQQGVPLTPSINDRKLAGYAVHQYLNTKIDDQVQMQIVKYGCPELLRTFPMLQMDDKDPEKIGAGDDHYVIALAYFCMGEAPPSRDPVEPIVKRWMTPKRSSRNLAPMIQ